MSNSQWNQDQAAGERAIRAWEKEAKEINKLAAERDEFRELLSAFIDASILKGFVVTREQWDRACILCGRYAPPFIKKEQ